MSEQVKLKSKYSIVDLFAGAGGLSYGFLQTDRFSIKAAFELNPNARQTYQRNHGEHVAMYSDVENALSESIRAELGQIDVVIGGPPCQGFSSANRQKNHAISQNNSLVKKFVQAVLNLTPKAFVMENVSLLQSKVHRFYVDENDQHIIKKYNISTEDTEIQLLDKQFLFEDSINIVNDPIKIKKYLWAEKDYFSLNVVYKARKNEHKLKATLEKHKKNLLSLAEKLIIKDDINDHITHYNYLAGKVIVQYFNNTQEDKKATHLCITIEPVIMIQRMLAKSLEIHNNKINVIEYTTKQGLVAKVTSMAVVDYIESILGSEDSGYSITKGVLSATHFGVPQKRMRFVIMGVKKEIAENITLPVGDFTEDSFRTVEDAIKDIENLKVATTVSEGSIGIPISNQPDSISELGQQLRNSKVLYNHIATDTTSHALERFKVIQQGCNFHDLPSELKTTYSDSSRTQNTIYLRLKYNEPSGTVVNVRKSMWIHPTLDRALSIREAARLQTFPDSFIFCGVKDSQYQQIGNAVPPMLAKALARHLCDYLDK
ncbi:DNA cytosine methyltransferase [Salmonella enterica subsp. enterica serovar Derby]|uniref:DNA (cytosine-5-)-methyltransferase n=4 Tax=Salmonella derby TaxID=28144 RepID=A0A5X0DMC1_SALDE|nr:DNA cytosine methyltransferase [Salmonella enterica]EDU1644140.1 DNA cytosine methyltransferase [Salmonella enterica subsp. enterica serovar Saintpaul]EDV1147024.1 DNA cytosine methyltransferase [Salmonella enterica subsp. enterica]EDV5164721.1 DNA cytosine methyltransferase [Salmonella enterica subsp. enterica serovar Hato]EED5954900.1 DNA cytosine methyltransferase [Salmonella enterica subsp. enterica serovar Agona]HAU6804554.1 DNA cytosine methyltransferase [Salmonella enterica subsp. en